MIRCKSFRLKFTEKLMVSIPKRVVFTLLCTVWMSKNENQITHNLLIVSSLKIQVREFGGEKTGHEKVESSNTKHSLFNTKTFSS